MLRVAEGLCNDGKHMNIILDNNIDQIAGIMAGYGAPAYRAGQLYKWLLAGVGTDGMTDIPAALRDKISNDYILNPAKIVKKLKSKDGTVKYLFELHDCNVVEGVLMKYKHGRTLCLSVQVGCRMGCVFCASGADGHVRNLSAGEILGQAVAAGADIGERVTNLVLMGSGEPFDNYDNTIKFLRLVTDARGLNIGRRNISVSTCGLVEGIKKLADEGMGVNLSISLHATTDANRQKIMPVAKSNSIAAIMAAARYYFDQTGRRVIIEYCLTKENTTDTDAKRLAELTRGLSCHVNLITLNKSNFSKADCRVGLRPPRNDIIIGCTKDEAKAFSDKLTQAGVSNTIRRSMGSDIEGACGQLRTKFVRCKEGENKS